MFHKKKCCSETKKISSRFNIDEESLKKMKKALTKRMKSAALNKVQFESLMREEGLAESDASSMFEVLDLDRNGSLGRRLMD